jgi:cyclopropane fatty-acyl-phospholipid synthase-like methyltransferase
MQTYGDTIQSCRTQDLKDLHKHTMQSAGMQSGQRILDAGCGICGPSIYFAKNLDVKIDAITVSPVQVEKAQARIKAEGLDKKINVICDDFYNADKHFGSETFDVVIFLESLGHSDRPNEVVKKMYELLKPGGTIYIKDYFINESERISADKIQQVISTINEAYCYNTQQLPPLISALRKAGFILNWVRNPDYQKAWDVVFEFEKRSGFDSWGGMEKFSQSEIFEMSFHKPR